MTLANKITDANNKHFEYELDVEPLIREALTSVEKMFPGEEHKWAVVVDLDENLKLKLTVVEDQEVAPPENGLYQ